MDQHIGRVEHVRDIPPVANHQGLVPEGRHYPLHRRTIRPVAHHQQANAGELGSEITDGRGRDFVSRDGED
jgi:hypothetical protein